MRGWAGNSGTSTVSECVLADETTLAGSWNEPTEEEKHRARLTACRYARTADEAREFLDMLDLRG